MGMSCLSTISRMSGILADVARGGVPVFGFHSSVIGNEVSVRLLLVGGVDISSVSFLLVATIGRWFSGDANVGFWWSRSRRLWITFQYR